MKDHAPRENYGSPRISFSSPIFDPRGGQPRVTSAILFSREIIKQATDVKSRRGSNRRGSPGPVIRNALGTEKRVNKR